MTAPEFEGRAFVAAGDRATEERDPRREILDGDDPQLAYDKCGRPTDG